MALAWLTPDAADLTGSQVDRIISLPGSLFFFVTGALSLLADEQNWERFGDATPEETSQFFADALDEYLMSSFRNVGMIAAFCNDPAVPPFWLFLNGQTVAQADYPELSAVVPSSWLSGANIILPDARLKFPLGSGPGIAAGAIGGSNTHTLTAAEMPSHSHTYREDQATVLAGAGALPVQGPIVVSPTSTAGSGNAHNNMPAYLAVRWWIYAGR